MACKMCFVCVCVRTCIGPSWVVCHVSYFKNYTCALVEYMYVLRCAVRIVQACVCVCVCVSGQSLHGRMFLIPDFFGGATGISAVSHPPHTHTVVYTHTHPPTHTNQGVALVSPLGPEQLTYCSVWGTGAPPPPLHMGIPGLTWAG